VEFLLREALKLRRGSPRILTVAPAMPSPAEEPDE